MKRDPGRDLDGSGSGDDGWTDRRLAGGVHRGYRLRIPHFVLGSPASARRTSSKTFRLSVNIESTESEVETTVPRPARLRADAGERSM